MSYCPLELKPPCYYDCGDGDCGPTAGRVPMREAVNDI